MYNNRYTWLKDGSIVNSNLWKSGWFGLQILKRIKTYLNFNFLGSPNCGSSGCYCAFLDESTRLLDDTHCSNAYPGICKRSLTTTVAPLLTSVSNCPSGWKFYGNSCYKFYDQTKLTFSQAQSFCSQQGKGSYLIEINSATEYSYINTTFLNTFTNSNAWVSIKKSIL